MQEDRLVPDTTPRELLRVHITSNAWKAQEQPLLVAAELGWK